MATDYFATGWYDAQRATFYASSLPNGTASNSRIRAEYRAGWIAERARRGLENLPAYFLDTGRRFYWIVAMEGDRPIYQVTNGDTPEGEAGYRDLGALMALKGDSFGD